MDPTGSNKRPSSWLPPLLPTDGSSMPASASRSV